MKKKLKTIALGIAALVLLGVAVYRDPATRGYFQTAPTVDGVPAVVAGFAHAMCVKDAVYLAAHASETIAASAPSITQVAWTCTGIRYMGKVDSGNGFEYFFVFSLTGPRTETWFGLSFDEPTQKVVGVE